MIRLVAAMVIVLLVGPAVGQELDRLTVRGKDIIDSQGRVMSMRGTNFGGWLMMETWIPSIEMEWHDHLPRLAEEVGVRDQLDKSTKAIGEFNDDTQHIDDYIRRLHGELATRVSKQQLKQYLDLFQREPSVFAAEDMDQLLRKRFGDELTPHDVLQLAIHGDWEDDLYELTENDDDDDVADDIIIRPS